MSEKTVWKFPIPMKDNFSVEMDPNAQILHVDIQQGAAFFWALVDPAAQQSHRYFRVAGTGHPVAEKIKKHLGTFLIQGGALVFHLFEVEPD